VLGFEQSLALYCRIRVDWARSLLSSLKEIPPHVLSPVMKPFPHDTPVMKRSDLRSRLSLRTVFRAVPVLCSLAAFSSAALAADPKPETAKAATSADATPDKKVNKDDLKKKLTQLQYDVTCNAATEPPFRNAYWDNHATGLYVDVIDGEALFASNHKFDSGTGWPSFFQPVNKGAIKEKEDRTHNMIRVEVISTKSGAHLGHLFPDGPRPTGMRYCINSASLRFIPVAELEKEGYGKYASLFTEAAPAEKAPNAAKK
jgi:methionine-R-sulfoxide reductase